MSVSPEEFDDDELWNDVPMAPNLKQDPLPLGARRGGDDAFNAAPESEQPQSDEVKPAAEADNQVGASAFAETHDTLVLNTMRAAMIFPFVMWLVSIADALVWYQRVRTSALQPAQQHRQTGTWTD